MENTSDAAVVSHMEVGMASDYGHCYGLRAIGTKQAI